MDYAYVSDKQIEDRLVTTVLNVHELTVRNKKILTSYKGVVVINGGEELVNRFAVEQHNLILVHPENHSKEDSLHNRNSGLNSVLCNLARRHNVTIGFSFSILLGCKGLGRSKLLGRMRQNVRLCRKYKVRMRLGSFATSSWQLRSDDCLWSFGRVIGMTPGEVKSALS